MAEVHNGHRARLQINGVHDGPAGVQDADGRLRVSFEPNLRRRSPIGVSAAILDGRAHVVLSSARSRLTPRVYVMELEAGPAPATAAIGG